MRLRWLLVLIPCVLVFYVVPARGCRYNVREVGFIDVGIDPYHLFGCISEGTSSEVVTRLQETIDAALMDTNIRFEVVGPDADANHPARQCLAANGIEELPAAVLLSPDGQSRCVDLEEASTSLAQALPGALGTVLHSPTRQEILHKAAESYGVVLLVEGPDREQNLAARQAAQAAIGHIAEQLEFLPKSIAKPPELVVLEQPALSREDVLLWTLGLEPEDVNKPHMAIFYGRGRWLGPLFTEDLINEANLTELLFIIGGDCECGLEHRWLQGTMLPARWDASLQATMVESLGFDPENPMVKMEMVSIVRRGMGGFDYPGVPSGYREVQVGGDVPDVEPPDEDGPREVLSSAMAQPKPVQEEVFSEGQGSELRILAVSLGGMAVLVAAASAVIIVRAKKT